MFFVEIENMDGDNLSEFFSQSEFEETNLASATSPDDIFSVLEAWEAVSDLNPMTPLDEITGLNLKDGEEASCSTRLVSQKSTSSSTAPQDS